MKYNRELHYLAVSVLGLALLTGCGQALRQAQEAGSDAQGAESESSAQARSDKSDKSDKSGKGGSTGSSKEEPEIKETSENISPPTEDELCELYAAVLEDILRERAESLSSESGYGLAYIDDDDLPELFWTNGGSHPSTVNVLTCGAAGEDERPLPDLPYNAFEVGSFGQFGCCVYTRKGGVIRSDYSGMGADMKTYYRMKGTEEAEILQTLETYMEPVTDAAEGEDDYRMKYFVDGAEVSEERYNEAGEKWKKHIFTAIDLSDMSPLKEGEDFKTELEHWMREERPLAEPIDHSDEGHAHEENEWPPFGMHEAYPWILGGRYWNVIDDPSGIESFSGEGTGVLELASYCDNPAERIAISIMDIDGNGFREMLLIDPEARGPYDGSQILAMYTVTGEEAADWVLVTEGWGRSRYYLLDDNTILHTGSSGAFSSCFGLYGMDESGTALKCDVFYFSEQKPGTTNELVWFKNTTESWEPEESIALDLTDDQIDDLVAEYADRIVVPDHFTFREYMDHFH